MTKALRKLFKDDAAFATALLAGFGHLYGTEAFEWLPDTILAELQDDLNIEISQVNIDKLMAGIAIVTTDKFQASLPDFIDLCNTLCGTPFNPEVFDPADSYEIAWGVVEAALLWPNQETQMNPQIPAYIEATLEQEGLIRAPRVLEAIVPSYKLEVDQATFSDDPDMYGAVFQTQRSKTQDIDDAVIRNLHSLAEQLDSLGIINTPALAMIQRLLSEGT